jgi:hypothetical protein
VEVEVEDREWVVASSRFGGARKGRGFGRLAAGTRPLQVTGGPD